MIDVKNWAKAQAKSCINVSFRYLPDDWVYARHRWLNRKGLLSWCNSGYYFVHIPKSAGTSLIGSVNRQLTGHYLYKDIPHAMRNIIRDRPHIAIIRDPVSRLLSSFRYAHSLEHRFKTTTLSFMTEFTSFNEYVRKRFVRHDIGHNYFLRPSTSFLQGVPQKNLWLVSFDFLESGINEFLAKVGEPTVLLDFENKTEKFRDLDVAVDDDTRRAIEERYGNDQRLYISLSKRPLTNAVEVL